MYTIKRAAELTGVPVATLRAWERRYAVVRPARTAAGYRLYDEQTLGVIVRMHSLVSAGWSPSQAAAEIARRPGSLTTASSSAGASSPSGFTTPWGTVGVPGEPGSEVPIRPDRGSKGSTIPNADSGPRQMRPIDPAVAEFIAAAIALDARAIDRALDEAFSRAGVEMVISGWLMPALRALGDAWAAGLVSVSGEHIASEAIQRRLHAAYQAAGLVSIGPRLVVGTPAGSRHHLGALAFAVVARRAGADVLYVGADLPAEEWALAAARHHADAIALGVTHPVDVPAARAAIDAVIAARPATRVLVGGAAASAVGAGEFVADLVTAGIGLTAVRSS